MAQIRIIAGLGYGLAGLLFYKNADGVGDYVSELGRASLHFWSRSPYNSNQVEDGENRGAQLGELSDKLDRLAKSRGETVHIHHGGGVYSSWFTTIVGGSVVAAVVVHYTGLFDLSGVMYVTQSKFKTVTDSLQEGVNTVNEALKKVRVELLLKIGVLETNLENARAELKDQIVTSSEAIRDDVALVSTEIKGVNEIVSNLELKLNSIDGGVGELRHALDKANKGIQLLVHVVAQSYRSYSGGRRQDNEVFEDLMDYSDKYLSGGNDASGQPLLAAEAADKGPLFKILSRDNLEGNADQGGGKEPAPSGTTSSSRAELPKSVKHLLSGNLAL